MYPLSGGGDVSKQFAKRQSLEDNIRHIGKRVRRHNQGHKAKYSFGVREDPIREVPEESYCVGKTQNHRVHLGTFARMYVDDPATKVSIPVLFFNQFIESYYSL